jgi:hypothetical protein
MLPRLAALLLLSAVGLWLVCASRAASDPTDYLQPIRLPGTVFPIGGGQLLFKTERRAIETNGAVYATSDFTYPNGELAVQDRIVYRAGELVSIEEDLLQLGEKAGAVIRPDPRHLASLRLFFHYTSGHGAAARTATASEPLQNDTLVNDMIGPFIASHWGLFEKGAPARFRLLVLSRKETVGFKLVKQGESSLKGAPVVWLRMEPTSIIIARLVDPLFFEVEKDPPHHVLQYKGRTTPLTRSGSKWKDLDALCVYDWAHVPAQTSSVPPQVNADLHR